MQDLQNYVYMPLWLVVSLTLFAGVGFEFLIYRVVRLLKRALYGATSGNVAAEPAKPKIEIVTLTDHRRDRAAK